jgi:hypothetical protein
MTVVCVSCDVAKVEGRNESRNRIGGPISRRVVDIRSFSLRSHEKRTTRGGAVGCRSERKAEEAGTVRMYLRVGGEWEQGG